MTITPEIILRLLSLSALVMISWLAWWLVFAGWGLLFARAWGRRVRSGEGLILAFWTGWSLVLVFLTLWHFVRRIDGLTAAAVAAIGLGSLIANGRRLLPLLRGWSRRRALGAAAFVLLAAWQANHTLMPPVNFDSGLYHLPQIDWISNYRIVPGLGNLHGRLAFNQSYFLYVAMLDTGPWENLAWHWAGGPLALTTFLHLILKLTSRQGMGRRKPGESSVVPTGLGLSSTANPALKGGSPPVGGAEGESSLRDSNKGAHPALNGYSLPLRPGEAPVRRIFWLLMLAPVIHQINSFNISSPSPDLPVTLLGYTIALELLDLIMLPPAAVRGLPWRVARLVLLGLAGITLKFAFLFMGGASAVLAVALAVRRLAERRRTGAARRLGLASAAMALLVLLPWAARDVILSGWIAYPLPLLPMPVPWRLPDRAVQQEILYIQGFARDPFKAFDWPVTGWKWLPTWSTTMLETQLFDFIIPIGLLAVLLGVLFYQRRRAVPAGDVRPMALFLGVPAASLIYWFCTAPHPRFAAGAPWVFIAGLGAFVLARFVPARARLARGLTAALMLVSFCGLRGFIPLTLPGSDRGFHPAPQVKDAFDYTTDHGLVIHTVPTGVYQTWQMPLPNTPYPKRKLRLRRPGDLQSGFIIDGPLTEKTS